MTAFAINGNRKIYPLTALFLLYFFFLVGLQEFSKEVDTKSSLRSSVLSTGNQLLRLKRVETAGLRTALGHIDTQWAELLTRIPVVQEKLHQVWG